MDELRKALRHHGRRRIKARAQASEESRAIAELIPRALEAGMTKAEICTLAEISRPALDTMLKAHAGSS